MKICRYWKLAVAAAAALSAMPELAHGQGRGGFGQAFRVAGDSPNDPSNLLVSASVQKELALTDDQNASLQKLRDDQTASGQAFFGQLMGLSADEMQKKLEERAKEARQKISEILAPKQMQRLDEINIQKAGIVALNFDDVAEKLELTAGQKEKIKQLGEDARSKSTELYSANNGQPLDKEKRQELKTKLYEINSQRKEKAMALLTDEQKANFEKLQGEKVDLSAIKPVSVRYSNRGQINFPNPANGLPAK